MLKIFRHTDKFPNILTDVGFYIVRTDNNQCLHVSMSGYLQRDSESSPFDINYSNLPNSLNSIDDIEKLLIREKEKILPQNYKQHIKF